MSTSRSNKEARIKYGKPVRVATHPINPEKINREFQKKKLKKNPKRTKHYRSDI